MKQENWQAVSDRYLSDEAKRDFAATTYPEDFDQAAYTARWDDLARRIEAALPIDPASEQARAFKREWAQLLQPFAQVATPAMLTGVERMYDHVGEWRGEQRPPFSARVWDFIKSVPA